MHFHILPAPIILVSHIPMPEFHYHAVATIAVPAILNFGEDRGTVQVCAELSIQAGNMILNSISITLSTIDNTGEDVHVIRLEYSQNTYLMLWSKELVHGMN